MKQQNRNLSVGMQGDDVKVLQTELLQLGFAIATNSTSASSEKRRGRLCAISRSAKEDTKDKNHMLSLRDSRKQE